MWLFLFEFVYLFANSHELLSNYPVLSDTHFFTSAIAENATSTPLPEEIKRIIYSEDQECRVKLEWLYPTQEKGEVPFYVVEDKITVKNGFSLNCQSKRVYDLKLTNACTNDGAKDLKFAKLRLFINDVNQYKPFFSQDIYETSYVEGEGHNYILKVTAYDQDCINDHHVCDYKIITKDSPFEVSSTGLIWPKIPLEGKTRSEYKFQIVGVDCTDESYSDPATVIVKIQQPCTSRFKVDTSRRFDIEHPFQNLKLQLCSFCKPVDIIARVALEFDDPNLIECSETICEHSNQSRVNLLQSFDQMDVKQPSSLYTYSFNGYDDYLDAGNSVIMQSAYFEGATIKFWLRVHRDPEPKALRQILCESDKSGINRHHFSVYIQYDLLTLICNQYPMNPPANHEFFPSEWSWNISQYQDGSWHYFSILLEFPIVELTINSDKIKLNKVVNDISMTTTRLKQKPRDTQLTIGACWHGKTEKYMQHFYGDLAGLQIMFEQIKRNTCHKNCSQRLEMDNQLSSEKFAFNGNKSVVILRSHDVNSLQALLASIKYLKSDKPVPLSVSLNGTVICENMPKLKISDLWLRGTSTEIHDKKTTKQNMKLSNEDSVDQPNDKIIQATPGYVYSGWLIAVMIALVSGLAIGTLMIVYNSRRQIKHSICPTEDLDWDNINFITNPKKINRRHADDK